MEGITTADEVMPARRSSVQTPCICHELSVNKQCLHELSWSEMELTTWQLESGQVEIYLVGAESKTVFAAKALMRSVANQQWSTLHQEDIECDLEKEWV